MNWNLDQGGQHSRWGGRVATGFFLTGPMTAQERVPQTGPTGNVTALLSPDQLKGQPATDAR